MASLLVLFAHPALDKSRAQLRLLEELRSVAGVELRDLYELYPDFDVDVGSEQAALAAHDFVVVQHPLYWYSVPPLLKQWIDLVLEHGWAYGAGGVALAGKRWLEVISAGGTSEGYRPGALHGHPIRTFLAPVERTAMLCGMTFLPPWLLYGTHRLDRAGLDGAAGAYRELLEAARDDRVDWRAAGRYATLDEALAAEPAILTPAPRRAERPR